MNTLLTSALFGRTDMALRRAPESRSRSLAGTRSPGSRSLLGSLRVISAVAFASLWLGAVAFGAEETCSSCGKRVIFSGDFVHRRAFGQTAIEGAPAGTENYYREGIVGSNFTATIAGLPDGRYIDVSYAQGCPLIVRPAGGGTGRRGGFGGVRGQPATPPRPLSELRAEALSNAANADILVYAGGINSRLEGEEGNAFGSGGVEGFSNGDRTRIELPRVQEEFIQALHATGKPLIMVNCSGSAMAVPWEAEHLPAILQAWYPGEEGGRAVGEVLFGDVNPSGHLPVTFYQSTTNLPAFTNYSMINRTYRYFTGKPLYAFGHGLSYTKFEFRSGKLESKKIAANGTAKVTFTVKNSGNRDGDEVAQVYFRHVRSSVPQPKLALCGFTRVHLKRGDSSQVTVEIPAARLRYWDTQKKQYVVEPGDYEFFIGAASDDISLKLPMRITAR
jgi:hypothetical protein